MRGIDAPALICLVVLVRPNRPINLHRAVQFQFGTPNRYKAHSDRDSDLIHVGIVLRQLYMMLWLA
jgi:hypothetical protein